MADNFARMLSGLAGPVAAPGISPAALGLFPFELERPAPLAVMVPAVRDFGTLRLVREGNGRPWFDRPAVRGPLDAVAILAPYCDGLDCEVFGLFLLDAQHRAIGGAPVEITRGLLNSALVHPREVFRPAIVAAAAAVVLWHNHPSGDPTPSAEDRAVTRQLVAAGRLLDIPVHDHVVIGRGRYVSFAELDILDGR